MISLSTHVLDTMHGCPAVGVDVVLSDGAGAGLYRGVTNGDGRCPDLPRLTPGRYRLAFGVAAYYRARGVALADPPFLDVVTIDFGVSGDFGVAGESGHYHVPLLVAPYGYSTYRGS
ncbi:hydroxyisourate hydrolase [Novosphingobium sp. Fuku2-ISO-50]|uniref:hydroxyisourate hydrolase n=1 Tax=Novosphingobium sp. Fuku2-ISO-50 TaxID=1739114 RepID=UPI000ADFACAE|nr:hydroxyisourate hydrolase [Novosphingobium sp. Fuku2-ISO-50]